MTGEEMVSRNQFIKKHLIAEEGLKNKVYLDTKGIPTIGVGRNLRDKGLNDNEIDFMLGNDIADCDRFLAGVFPNFFQFSVSRQTALISVTFAGEGTFLKFVKMIEAIKAENWKEAAKELLDSKYAKVDVPNRAHRLAKMLEEG